MKEGLTRYGSIPKALFNLSQIAGWEGDLAPLISLSYEIVSARGIPDKVSVLLKDKPIQDQIIYVKAGSQVKNGTVVSVVDSIREAGYDRIGLVSRNLKKPLGATE